jgi:pimeloyl-ACP methyl ester carboxylesterase
VTGGAKSRFSGLRASDLRGLAQLATQATTGVTRIAEDLTHSVWQTVGLAGSGEPGKNNGVTGLVFDAIHGITRLAGKSADLLFDALLPLLKTADATPPDSYPREAVLAALNGVMGDRLQQSNNPLATPMRLRYRGAVLDCSPLSVQQTLDVADATGKVLLLIHGLCMNDLQWETRQPNGRALNHGTALADALGYTPIYVRYNSGLHTSTNGRELAQQLQHLATHWPVPLTEISVLAHSMGGLVVRSALQSALTDAGSAMTWPRLTKKVVFMGTPHEGAPLEKAGNWVDVLLGSTPYTKPFARLGQLRSAGITDLRYGHVVDADWLGHDRFRRKPDSRTPVPLPSGIAFYAIAATVASARSALSERLVGDGLVPLPSALGQHAQAHRSLQFAKGRQWVAYGMHHMELLSSPAVHRKLRGWLAAEPDAKKPATRA